MRAQFEIGFDDVDFARVLYYARYYTLVERAMMTWLHTRDVYYRDLYFEHHVAMPIVTSHCRYRGPLRVEDRCEVRLELQELSRRGFRLSFHIVRLHDDTLVGEGYQDHRFVDPEKRGPTEPTDALYAALEAMAAESAGHLGGGTTPP